MRIVQISDIHLSKENIYAFRKFYLEALIGDLKKFHSENKIDVILLTGDLVDKGGESFSPNDPYQIIEDEFILPLVISLDLNVHNILFIPGNHDIDRTKIDAIYENGLKRHLINIESVNNQLIANKDKFNFSNDRISSFKNFEQRYHKGNPNYYYSNNESYFIYEADGLSIGFVLLNDSWRCSKDLKKEEHVIGVNQLYNAKSFFEEKNTNFNIVVFHHPTQMFSEIERQEISNILQKFDFEIVFSGHVHQPNFSQLLGPSGNIISIVARSAFNDPREELAKFQPGYNIVDIDFSSLKITFNFRSYIHSRYTFDSDTQASQGGIYDCQIIPKGEKKNLYELYELTTKTNNSHIDDFNSSLLTYNTDSVAPKNINDLFVPPKLTENPQGFERGDKKEKFFTLQDILGDKNSYIIFGSQESGKTTLLNKLSVEISKSFFHFQKVPVILDFKRVGHSDILSNVRKYLNESSIKVQNLASEGRLVLLIDNYQQREEYDIAEQYLTSFLKIYRGVRAIITTSESLDDLIQNNNFLLNDFQFKRLFIGNVGVLEFKSLAKRWFTVPSDEWYNTNVERLIGFFKILRIPRNFFSVSMYLWIIEKQSDFKPINRNYLVNKFLQLILEGLANEEGKAGSFNLERKKEILTEIAYEMYSDDKNKDDYSITREKCIELIKSYFSKNQRSYDSEHAFQFFVTKGILRLELSNGHSILTFRFESFFQYFLSLNIDRKESFKEKVLADSEILSFIEEMDFYSGRNPSDKSILERSLNLLKTSFSEIDAKIERNTDKYLPKKALFLGGFDTEKMRPDLKGAQMSEQEIDQEFEKQMQNLPIDDSIKIKEVHDHTKSPELCIELTARILKNAENIQDPQLINHALDVLIEKQGKYVILAQSVLVSAHREGKLKNHLIPLIALLPSFLQHLLFEWVGTDFLEIPLEKKIKNYLNSKEIRQFEMFLTVLLFFDLRPNGYLEYLRKAIKQVDNGYLAELYFFKIMLFYVKLPKGSSLTEPVEQLLMSLLTKINGITKEQAAKKLDKDIREKRDEFGGEE